MEIKISLQQAHQLVALMRVQGDIDASNFVQLVSLETPFAL